MENKVDLEEIKNRIENLEKEVEIPYIVNEIGFEQGHFDYGEVRYCFALRGIVYDIALDGIGLIGNARLELHDIRRPKGNKKRLMIVNGKLESIYLELADLNFLSWSISTKESESDVLIKDFGHTALFDEDTRDKLYPEKPNYKPRYKLDLEDVMAKRGINLGGELVELTFFPIDNQLKKIYYKLKGLKESFNQLKGHITDFEYFPPRD
ncbi:MAG: hypothetical protein Q7J54_05800 [Candidatus Woesearchaeota archaeon]|nr:hypothetical protein [Candidatus Woesearchaeota archaeon]